MGEEGAGVGGRGGAGRAGAVDWNGWERGGRGADGAHLDAGGVEGELEGWPHAASSPPHADGQDACVAPDTSPRERCQCSPCTTTYLHKTLPEHVSLIPSRP